MLVGHQIPEIVRDAYDLAERLDFPLASSTLPNESTALGDTHVVSVEQSDLQLPNRDRITKLVKVGGQIVTDDLTPVELWPPE